MSNRAGRRQRAGNIASGRVTKREAKPRRPIGQHGIEVDTADGLVHVALHAGEVCVSVAWSESDARTVASMIMDAVDVAGTPAENIVVERSSGIVVARSLPST